MGFPVRLPVLHRTPAGLPMEQFLAGFLPAEHLLAAFLRGDCTGRRWALPVGVLEPSPNAEAFWGRRRELG